MSLKLLSAVWNDAPYQGAAFVALLALADYADDDGCCWPSITSLARKSRLGLTATKDALKKLRIDGILVLEESGDARTSNRYRVVLSFTEGRSVGDPGHDVTQATTRPSDSHVPTVRRSRSDLGVGRPATPNRHIEPPMNPSLIPLRTFVLPDWIPEVLWNDFETMRKKLRKPLTDKARDLLANKLLQLKDDGNNPAAVLEQSIENGWQGLFPLRQAKKTNENSGRRKYLTPQEWQGEIDAPNRRISPAVERQRASDDAIRKAAALLEGADGAHEPGSLQLRSPGGDSANGRDVAGRLA